MSNKDGIIITVVDHMASQHCRAYSGKAQHTWGLDKVSCDHLVDDDVDDDDDKDDKENDDNDENNGGGDDDDNP